jgi:hypothetical protein
MAESAKKCADCGLLLKVFSGLTINGDSYHDYCWERRPRPVPAVTRAVWRGAAREQQARPKEED